MNLKVSIRIGFSLIVLLLFQCTSRSPLIAQDPLKSHNVISRNTYERVMDTVFQRNEANQDYDFVIRFEPSFAPESQIVIKRTAAKTQIIEYTSLSGNIYRKLDDIKANGGKEDVVEMAKLIEIRKRVLEVSNALLNQWCSTLPSAMAASMKILNDRGVEEANGVGTTIIDGTFYSLWYDQGGSKLFFRGLDHEATNREVTGELEVVRWMNTVRRDVEKLK